MTYYHGSPVGNLKELKPILSEHGKPLIYFATNPLVALLYAVKPVPKPFSYYPYGFDEEGNVVYSEYFENSFEKLYKGKKGYLYECDDLTNVEQPTQICCAYACAENVKIDRMTEIPDLYEYYIKKSEAGVFKIKHYFEISEKEMNFILNDMKQAVTKFGLDSNHENPMSVFIKEHFPSIF